LSERSFQKRLPRDRVEAAKNQLSTAAAVVAVIVVASAAARAVRASAYRETEKEHT